MPRAEAGTPKAIANAMKSKGLQRLRWYCQVCSKQCRDENGFKCHVQSESHLRQMLVVGESAGKHIADFSMQFQSEFVALLSRRFGTKRVLANRVYQEYIQDKHHLHMNATRWVTLTEFAKHLGRTGVARVDETEKGWFIAWIDNSPKALAKQEASMKKERMTTSDEQRERNMLAEQIERANAEAGPSGSESPPPADEGLKREDGEAKVVLSLSLAPKATTSASPPDSTSTPSSSTSISLGTPSSGGLKLGSNPLKLGSNPLKANPLKATNPLKRPNVFKQASAASKDKKKPDEDGLGAGNKRELNMAEALMFEDQERKRRRMERERDREMLA